MAFSEEYAPDANKLAKFEIPWKITSDQLAAFSTTKITKDFIASHENVPLRLRVEFEAGSKEEEEETMNVSVTYVDGILPELNLTYTLTAGTCGAIMNQTVKRGGTETLPGVYTRLLTSQASLEIWTMVFRSGKNYVDFGTKYASMFGQFGNITDQDNQYSDVTLVAADGTKFYCHRVILAAQSDGFGGLFRNPMTDEAKKGVFDLPTVAGNVLEVALRYLYTGIADLNALDFSFADAVELADFAEQYGLKHLKKAGIDYLWKNLGNNLDKSVDLIRFADLHDDMKYLKDRAFDYLAENFDALSSQVDDIFNAATNQDQRLQAEFRLFADQRLTAKFE